MPVSVVFGAGKRHLAGELLKSYGTKALVVTDSATNGRDLVREVEKSLKDAGISVARFAHVTGKSLDITADSASMKSRRTAAISSSLSAAIPSWKGPR